MKDKSKKDLLKNIIIKENMIPKNYRKNIIKRKKRNNNKPNFF